MTDTRWLQLMQDDETALTEEEIAEGWHFCPEWDSLLIGPGMGELLACLCNLPPRPDPDRPAP